MADAILEEALASWLEGQDSTIAVGENLFFGADPDSFTGGSVIRGEAGERDHDLEKRNAVTDILEDHIREEMIQIKTHGARYDDSKLDAKRIWRILDGRRRVTLSAVFSALSIDAIAPPQLITTHDEEEEEGEDDEGFVEYIWSANYVVRVLDTSTL